MTVLLTFLGTAPYSETTYVLGDQRHTSRFCPAAVANFERPERTLIVVTKDARAKHFEALADEIAAITTTIDVPIPDGHSEDDLWAIFDALTAHIAEGTELVVDITYGFRSLPFLSFLALAFLRVAKGVNVKAVYYGAYDARNVATNESPIFDLTPFVTLLDWTLATDQLLATGDSTPLAGRLRAAHQLPWQSRHGHEQMRLPHQLQNVASTLEKLGQAMRLARPEEVMKLASAAQSQLLAARSEAEIWAKPFHLLLDRTAADYAALAVAVDPRDAENAILSLETQRSLVRWYVARRQYVQAIVLAREWVVSFMTRVLGWDLIGDRQAAEDLLNAGIKLRQKGVVWRLESEKQAAMEAALELWSKLPDLRNDIAHVGMRARPRSVGSIINAANDLPAQLGQLAQFLDQTPPLSPSPPPHNDTASAGNRSVPPSPDRRIDARASGVATTHPAPGI